MWVSVPLTAVVEMASRSPSGAHDTEHVESGAIRCTARVATSTTNVPVDGSVSGPCIPKANRSP